MATGGHIVPLKEEEFWKNMKKSGSYDFLKNSIEMLESYFLLDHTDKRERVFEFELSAANYNVTFSIRFSLEKLFISISFSFHFV